jgi:hypothetical protein
VLNNWDFAALASIVWFIVKPFKCAFHWGAARSGEEDLVLLQIVDRFFRGIRYAKEFPEVLIRFSRARCLCRPAVTVVGSVYQICRKKDTSEGNCSEDLRLQYQASVT